MNAKKLALLCTALCATLILPASCFAGQKQEVVVSSRSSRTSFVAGDFKTNWSGSAKHKYVEKWTGLRPEFSVWIEIKGFEFCILPPEIGSFDKIGDLEQYKYRRFALMQKLNDKTHTFEGSIATYFAVVDQNQILVLRKNGRHVGIKPLEIKDNRTLVYEWEYLYPTTATNITNLANQEVEVKTGISEAPLVDRKIGCSDHSITPGSFHVPGIDASVDFAFTMADKDQIMVLFNAKLSLVEKVWRSCTTENKNPDDIKDPSLCLIEEMDMRGAQNVSAGNGFSNDWKTSPGAFLLKVDDKFVAIKPLSLKDGVVTYQWKFWPAPPKSKTEVATAPVATATMPAPVSLSAQLSLKKRAVGEEFFIAGLKMIWKKSDESADKTILSIECKSASDVYGFFLPQGELQSIDKPDFAFRKIKKVMDVPIRNNNMVFFLVGKKCVGVQLKSAVGDIVVYDYKYWPEVVLKPELASISK